MRESPVAIGGCARCVFFEPVDPTGFLFAELAPQIRETIRISGCEQRGYRLFLTTVLSVSVTV